LSSHTKLAPALARKEFGLIASVFDRLLSHLGLTALRSAPC
jgi:hypothetical protein